VTSIDSLLGALLGAPALPGAKCRRRHRLFDEPAEGERPAQVAQRHQMALRLCESCPALAPCEDWVMNRLSPRDRPYGVIAGRVRTRRKNNTDERKPK